MRKALFVLACLVFGALAGLGCGGGNSSNSSSSPVTSAPRTSNSLVFTVSTPQGRYPLGVAVPVTFTVVNTGTQAANMDIATCSDFVAQVNQGANLIWTGPSIGCVSITRSISIPAGATQTYNVTWNQTDYLGNARSSGTYTLLAKLTPSTLNGIILSSDQLANFTSNPISVTIAP